MTLFVPNNHTIELISESQSFKMNQSQLAVLMHTTKQDAGQELLIELMVHRLTEDITVVDTQLSKVITYARKAVAKRYFDDMKQKELNEVSEGVVPIENVAENKHLISKYDLTNDQFNTVVGSFHSTQYELVQWLLLQGEERTIEHFNDDARSFNRKMKRLLKYVHDHHERFDDMNFLTQSGRFFIGASAGTNSAVSASFYIMVDAPQADRITQTQWKDLDGSLMYRRTYNGSSWTPWTQMVMSSTLLNIFHDSWSLGTSTNDGITKQLITGINGQADGTLVLSGKSIVLNSQTIKGNDFIIGSANIANGAIGTAQIGDAAITSAKIASLDARKITTGQLSGPSLNIDLDQGNVFFQKGRIYDSKTQIDVNIDQAYIRTTNGGGSATLQNGRLLLTGPVYNNGQTIDSNPYFSVSASLLPTFSNQPDGAVGSLLQSKDFSEISVNGHGNIGFLANMAAERGAGIGISAVTGTYIAGNNQGVILSGGKDIGGMGTAESPNFVVGYDDSKGVDGKDVGGNSILARANNFVIAANNYSVDKYGNMSVPKLQNSANITFESTNQSIVFRTGNDYRLQIRENGYIYLWNKKFGSGGSSLQVAGDGALFVQSSATKYKEDIQYDGGTSVGDKFLTLDPATWQDKDEYEQRKAYSEKGIEPDHNIHLTDKRYYGLIAEDLVKAGLEEFVVRDEVTGEVNGLEYDKVAISLIPVVRKQRDAINTLRLEVERLKQK